MPRQELTSNELAGVLFTRRAEGKQPDIEGNVCVDGVQYRVAGWTRTAKSGSSYVSLKLSRADGQTWRRQNGDDQREVQNDEDIPF